MHFEARMMHFEAKMMYFDSFGSQIFQNDGRIFFDEFFMRLKRKRAVFRQILAGGPFGSSNLPFRARKSPF